MGPVLIFDKSTLQSLSLDEAVWLENFFHSNITPIFFIETLADLSKPKTTRRAELLVAELARKTPIGGSFPNGFHQALVGNDLAGYHPPMTNRVVLVGGVNMRNPEGKVGAHFDEFDEATAMARWQDGKFHEIERAVAGRWRSILTNIDFRSMMKQAMSALGEDRVATLDEARLLVEGFVKRSGVSVVRFAREFLGIGPQWQEEIDRRYSETGDTPLNEFAPYAAYVLRVSLFFYTAMASHLIARERPSNMADIAYLYYLPFCQVFASNDKLHARTAPMFCDMGQEFVDGKALKAGLRELNEYYSGRMEEIEKVGIMRFAQRPPRELDNAVTQLWDKFMPKWREVEPRGQAEGDRATDDKMILKTMRDTVDKSVPLPPSSAPTEAEYTMITRKMPVRRGRWRVLPPEVEK